MIATDNNWRNAPGVPAAAAKPLQSCPTLCDPIDGSPPGSPVPGILQARTLEWVAISFFNAWKWKVKVKSESEVTQLCLTLRDPMDCSPPGSSIHGIFQARVPGSSPGGSRVIQRWGRRRRLWKNTYLITDIERLEADSVVGRLVEKKRLNNLDYVE